MSSRQQPDRSRLIRSRLDEKHRIVVSRKRKLREFYAVCATDPENPGTNTPTDLDSVNVTRATPDEQHFLDLSDILQHRILNESNLPTRRPLQLEATKRRLSIRKVSPDTRPEDSLRKAPRTQREASKPRKSRAPTPTTRSDSDKLEHIVAEELNGHESPMQRSASKGSQTDLPAKSVAVREDIDEETLQDAPYQEPPIPVEVVPLGQPEREMIQQLERRPNSPGFDQRRATSLSVGDTIALDKPSRNGLRIHGGGPSHKAPIANQLSKEAQERHVRETRRRRDHLSINPPGGDSGRTAEALSSPGSTEQSAMTPALNDASTDTSPENEGRYDAELMEKEDGSGTPLELRRSSGDLAQQGNHDLDRQALGQVDRREVLMSKSVNTEESKSQHVLRRKNSDGDHEMRDATSHETDLRIFTEESENAVEDTTEDEVSVQLSRQLDFSSRLAQDSSRTRAIIEGLESDKSPAPTVDTTTVTMIKDSFESSSSNEADKEGDLGTHITASPLAKLEHSRNLDGSNAPKQPAVDEPKESAQIPDRMITRVSSGALRQKSVSEILGEIPSPNTISIGEHGTDKLTPESTSLSHIIPSYTKNASFTSHVEQNTLEQTRERRRKLANVVFPVHKGKFTQVEKDKFDYDYFSSLFLATATTNQRGALDIDKLLESAHKTISTNNAYAPIQENQTVKVLRRIYSLQSNGKWSLRQPKRSEEPQRPVTHRDVLLQEASWLRTDFRNERKWKMAVARNLALECQAWVNANAEEREAMQVKVVELSTPSDDIAPQNVEEIDRSPPQQSANQPGTGTVAPRDMILFVDGTEDRDFAQETSSPWTIFTYDDDNVIFPMRDSPVSRRMLDELPSYGSPLSVPSGQPPSKSDPDPDRHWKREALPLSKYVDGRMLLKQVEPPRKKSRYQYDTEPEDDKPRDILPAEKNDVALFNPEYKFVRDRIHAGHQFRPPSEFQMPNQSFFENRQPSQWTQQEDDDLRCFVRDYQYNWSLISNLLTPKSLFISGAERRTPWECFERWVSLEGLPGDMQKTHYFRTYSSRVEAANRIVTAAAIANAPQPNANGQILPPRRRTTASIRVERRRNQKHLTIVDAMRKLAKKREGALQKQQAAAALAATRKPPETPQQRIYNKTPQELSKIKHDQTEKMKQSIAAMQLRRLEQQQRAMEAMRANPQGVASQFPNGPNGQQNLRPPQQQPHGAQVPVGLNGVPTNSQTLQVPGQNRPRPQMSGQMSGPLPSQMPGQMLGQIPNQAMPNGLRPPQQMMSGATQAQMQNMQSQMPVPNLPLDVGLINQAHTIQQQQRQAIQIRHQGQMPIPGQMQPQYQNSPPRPNMNGMSPPPGFPQIQNNMIAFTNTNGNVSSPGTGPSSQGLAGSPRMGQPSNSNQGQMQTMVMEQQLRKQFPNATQDEIMLLLREQINKSASAANAQKRGLVQSAMNAAAGANMAMAAAPNMINGVNGRMANGAENSPQMYAQMLRLQQENQQKASQAAQQGSGVGNHQRTTSGSSTK